MIDSSQLCFFLSVFSERVSAILRIERILATYPDAAIFSISDGVEDHSYADYCRGRQIPYFCGSRLKLHRFGGAWSHRYIKFFIEEIDPSRTCLVKIDPSDSGIHRPLNWLPDLSVPVAFGSLYDNPRLTYPNLHGGAQFISRSAAEILTESETLLTLSAPGYCPVRRRLLRPQETPQENTLAIQDTLIYQACKSQGISLLNFSEVCCNSRRTTRQNIETQFAFTHPYYYPGDAGYSV